MKSGSIALIGAFVVAVWFMAAGILMQQDRPLFGLAAWGVAFSILGGIGVVVRRAEYQENLQATLATCKEEP